MSKAILEFDMSNFEDTIAFKQATAALDALGALWDIEQELRSLYKYDDTLSQEQLDIIEKIRDKVTTIISEHNLDLGVLYS